MWSFNKWRLAVKAALVIALFEGALRKWVFPGGQELIYFLKDVFLVGAYIRFFLAPDLDVRATKLRAPYMLVILSCMFLMPATLNSNIGSVLLAAYGLKFYVFYIPLMFMMPYLFRTQEEMVRQVTWYALLAIPICLLGILQWRSGAASIWNVYADQQAMDQTGASLVVEDDAGNVVMELNDLLASYNETGIKPEDAKFLSANFTVGDPIELNKPYKLIANFLDNNSESDIICKVDFTVKN